MMRAIVSAGGTGGHIYPALAIIHKIKEKEPNSEILYIGTTDRMEHKIIPEAGIPYVGIKHSGLDRKRPWRNIEVWKEYKKSVSLVKEKIKEFKPDVVLGIGGYVTTPVISSAKKLGYKTFIHEQNSIPGVSNRFLSRYADKIGVSLPESTKYFPKNKVFFSGNPRSEEVLSSRPVDKKSLGLTENKPLVLIVMGSLGSTTMNQKLKETLNLFKDKPYEVIFVTGQNYYETYKSVKVSNNVKIMPYLNNMLSVLHKTDLIVSRAGASTIAEITALGIPSILIPSPYVTHNHQLKNAQALENKKAALILEEKDYDKQKLVDLIDDTLKDKKKYQELKQNAQSLAVTDSATKIYQVLRKLIDDGE